MLFNSYEFLFLFFPLVLLGCFICGRLKEEQRKSWTREKFFFLFLLVMSLLFYGWLYPSCVLILLVSMAVNFLLAGKIEKVAGISQQQENECYQKAEDSADKTRTADILKGENAGNQKEEDLSFQESRNAGKQRGEEENAGDSDRRTVRSKKLLTAGIIINVAGLAVFKYFHLTAPGISFFTFTQIAFLVECYKGSIKGVKALEYGLYVSFFPKLIQGPIVLPEEMLGQFKKYRLNIDWEKIYRGVFLFILGLFKKVIIADTLGGAVDFGYTNLASLNSGDSLIVMLSYTLQLYFDFSGYCDMAMGIAWILGFELPLNFNSPYKAGNIIEFWDRWHITLTKFFTRYLYIPLGGSRKGKIRTYVNCLIVFFVSGLWHGTGWQFIIWGIMHGVLNVLTRMWQDRGRGKERSDNSVINAANVENITNGKSQGILRGISVFFTFLYVNAAWVFFRAPSVGDALSLFGNIFKLDFGRLSRNLADCFNLDEFWYVIKVFGLDDWQYARYILMVVILVCLLLLVFKGKTAVDYVKTAKPGVINTVLMVIWFVWSVLALSGVSTFLYFNF